MSITETNPTTTATEITGDYELPAFDLYRDIHKGIRSELFAVTSAAGCLDHTDRVAWLAFGGHLTAVASVLGQHAHHEDVHVGPAIEQCRPALQERLVVEHDALDLAFRTVVELVGTGAEAPAADQRRLAQMSYLKLASFTAEYLRHQELEELVVTPLLVAAIGPEAMLEVHGAIVGSIPPDEMARTLTLMLPAMNVDDRTELLGGMQMGAPAEVFAGVVSLARSVLAPADFAQVAARLGLR